MAKTNYYERENFEEFMLRLFERILTIMLAGMLVLTIFVIRRGNKEIEELEKAIEIENSLNYYERKPIEEMVSDYIDTLPLPRIEVEESISDTEVALYEQTDVELLAKLMYAEEGIFIYRLPEDEAKYVNQLAGSVVIHRRNMNYGGAETIEEVIYADGQYECVENGSINQEIPDIVYEWAEELLRDGPIGPEDMIYQSEFKQGSDVYDQIGNQYFCTK